MLTGLKPKQPCYIMRCALQKEKFGTIAWKELLGGANGDKEEVTAIVHLRDDLALGKERWALLRKIIKVPGECGHHWSDGRPTSRQEEGKYVLSL